MAAPNSLTDGTSPPSNAAGKPPPRSSSHGRMPCARTASNTRAAERIGGPHACGSRCWDPTWNETPAGSSPRRAASRSNATASSTEQPYLRDNGQSDPDPEVTIRTSIDAPGAASASLATSPGESSTNSRTPRSCASRRWSRRATGLECTRWDAGAPAASAARTSAGLATSKWHPACASARSSTGCGLAFTA